MIVDLIHSELKCLVHAEPAWLALPGALRGERIFRGPPQHSARHPSRLGERAALVASRNDATAARHRGYRRIALLEHGIGQSYQGLSSGGYPGGAGRDMVGLFLSPNEHAAERDQQAYPDARVVIVGCPRLDTLPNREGEPGEVVAVAFHWTDRRVSELRSALPHYRDALSDLAERFTVIGHAHPMAMRDVLPVYEKAGIEVVESFDEVCRRADVYVADNTSTLYEFASTGRPVVVLDAPWYRPFTEHGLRFWAASDVGLRCQEPDELPDHVEAALADPPEAKANRDTALDIVYAYRSGAAKRAAKALVGWLG